MLVCSLTYTKNLVKLAEVGGYEWSNISEVFTRKEVGVIILDC